MTSERYLKVLLSPVISEKVVTGALKKNEYAFKVLRNANKADIKTAVEKLFEVKVTDVRVMNMKPKTKRNRKGLFKTKAWKKAFISVKAEESSSKLKELFAV